MCLKNKASMGGFKLGYGSKKIGANEIKPLMDLYFGLKLGL